MPDDMRPLRPVSAERKASAGSRTALAIVAALVFIVLPVAAGLRYPGSLGSFVLFEASFALMLALLIPRPRSYAFTSLAVLLFLGFWVKFNLHTVLDYAYQEPIGSFDGSGANWDNALLLASYGAIGASTGRLIALVLSRSSRTGLTSRGPARVPPWFLARRKLVWIVTAATAIALIAANLSFAFYAIGVDPRLVLPAPGNAVVGWLIKLGLALWIATLVNWELRLSSARPDTVLFVPIAEAAATSVSALSRGIYLFHVIPYCLVLLDRSSRPLRDVGGRRLATLGALALVGFVLSLGAVSALRLLIYPASSVASSSRSTPPQAPRISPRAGERLDAERVSFAVRQIRGLFVERWNGMEGVMAISAHDELGDELLMDALSEDPAQGQDSIYQRISRADLVYDLRGGYTFLTLPGTVGILGYGGSLGIVIGGMALLTLLVVGIERLFQSRVNNCYAASIAGFAMASELTQANFPYLLGTFFLFLVLSLGAIGLATVGPRALAARTRLPTGPPTK